MNNLNFKYAVVAVAVVLAVLVIGEVGGVRSDLASWWSYFSTGGEIQEEEYVPKPLLPVTPVKLNEPQTNFNDTIGGKPAPRTMTVRLNWEVDESANPEFAMYKIYRDADGDFSSGALPIVEIIYKDRRTHTDLGLDLKPYYYKVVVIDQAGQRVDSNIVIAQP